MLKLIIGVKGTGKTKELISLCNKATEETKGCVVCIEKGCKLIHEIKHSTRLVDTDQYNITDANGLYGFVAGMYASNHDITDIFVDSALKICKNDIDKFVSFIDLAAKLSYANGINIVVTSSIPVEGVPESLKAYID